MVKPQLQKLLTKTAFLVAVLLGSHDAVAEFQVGRYMTTKGNPTHPQKDLLASIVSARFEEDVTTVGGAVEQLISNFGYQLSDAVSDHAQRATLLSLNLPAPHRHLGPMPLRAILNTLVGPSWILVEDPVHRLISFQRCM